jgi:hypothetical protein
MTTSPIGTKLDWNVHWKYTKETRGPKCPKGCCMFLIFFSESKVPIGTKLDRNVYWMKSLFFVD